MASNLGTLTLDLVAKTGAYVDGLSKAERETKKFRASVEKNFKAAGTAILGLTVAGAAATAALIKNSIDNADALLEQSQAYGVNIELLSAYRQGAEKAGVSSTELATGLGKLARAIDDDSDALKRLSISTKENDGSLRKSADVLGDIADRFATMPDGAQKTALAIDLLGRSGANLIPFLNEGSAGLREMEEVARRTGNVISLETAQAADEFNDNLTTMRQLIGGIGNELAADLLPSLVELTNIVNDEDFQNGIKGFVGFIADGVVVAAKLAENLASVAKYAHLLRFVGGPIGIAANAPGALDALSAPSVNNSRTGTVDRSNPASVVPPAIIPLISEEEITAQKTLNDLIDDRLTGFKEQVALQGRTTELAKLQAEIETGKFKGASSEQLDLLQAEAMYADSIAAEIELKGLIDARAASYGNVINALGEMSEVAKLNFDIAQGAFPGASEEDLASLRAYAESVDAIAWADKRREANEAFAEMEAGLEKQIALVGETSEAAILLYDIEHGGYEQFSEDQQGKLLLLAQELEAREQAQKEIEEQQKATQRVMDELSRNTQDILADFLKGSFDDGFKGVADRFKTLLADMAAEAVAADIANFLFGGTKGGTSETAGGWLGALGGMFGAGQSKGIVEGEWDSIPRGKAGSGGWDESPYDKNRGGGFLNTAMGLFSTFAGLFDSGGSIGAGQWGIAGENGAEIIRGPANITSTKDTAALMGKGGNTNNVTFNFSGITNKQEAQQAASVAAKQWNRMTQASSRMS